MESRTEHYRSLARDCLKLADQVPFGTSRDTLLEMAREWERLADQQKDATDLRKKE